MIQFVPLVMVSLIFSCPRCGLIYFCFKKNIFLLKVLTEKIKCSYIFHVQLAIIKTIMKGLIIKTDRELLNIAKLSGI